MEFSVNHPILFVLVGIIVAAVLAQSVYFLLKAVRRSKQIGMDRKLIKKNNNLRFNIYDSPCSIYRYCGNISLAVSRTCASVASSFGRGIALL